jgi:menaquinone-dependent protoporphyrinogen oxidase
MLVGMSARGLRRRRFLKAGGTAAGALLVGGGGVWVASSPRIEFPEPSYPGTKAVGDKVLVAYASKAGSTAEVAGAIGKRLADTGLAVDVRRARNVRSVDGYAAVIVGSAIRAGHWLSEAVSFVKTHKEALATRKTAFFTMCMTLRQDTPEHREKVAAYLKPVRDILEPDKIEFFAGKMDYGKLALAPRLIVRGMKVAEGDFRNWDAISSWARGVANQIRESTTPSGTGEAG